MITLSFTRMGTILTSDPDEPREAWGVLNPASARSRDGTLYLFPRAVAKGNVSRIALGRVCFDAAGNPVGLKRLGYVLELHHPWESGGLEDPRITYLALLDRYVMVYTAIGPDGPRIALAASHDLVAWQRMGPVHFGRCHGVDFDRFGNKDAVLFPDPVLDPWGQPAFALLHRPTYRVPGSDGRPVSVLPRGVQDARPGIWISYTPVDAVLKTIRTLTRSVGTEPVASPQQPWERLKIGAGTPPILTGRGWLLFYHGVSGRPETEVAGAKDVCYQVGAMLLDREDPRRVLDRSTEPVLSPVEPSERHGRVPNVVFPTAVDVRGQRLDIYYGAADCRIAVATTHVSMPVYRAPSVPSSSGTTAA